MQEEKAEKERERERERERKKRNKEKGVVVAGGVREKGRNEGRGMEMET